MFIKSVLNNQMVNDQGYSESYRLRERVSEIILRVLNTFFKIIWRLCNKHQKVDYEQYRLIVVVWNRSTVKAFRDKHITEKCCYPTY